MNTLRSSVTRPSRRASLRSLVALMSVGAVIALSGCAPDTGSRSAGLSERANDTRIAKWVSGDGGAEIKWQDCAVQSPAAGQGEPASNAAQCGRLTVPVDWFAPGGKTTEVAVVRVLSTGTAKGDLLVNPGGPGVPGSDLAASLSFSPAVQPLLQNFNLVGFDPRGVASPLDIGDPLTCGELAPTGCKASKKLARHASTVSVAHDMEYLRVLLGDAPLSYLGYSYGTYLGSMYARLFPASVGAMVLDGPAPAVLSSEKGQRVQTQAIEQSVERFLRACVSGEIGECPFSGTVADAKDQLDEWASTYEKKPLELDGGVKFTDESLEAFIVASVYGPRSTWPMVAATLLSAKNGDTTALTLIAGTSAEVDDVIAEAVLCPIASGQEECDGTLPKDPRVSYTGASTIVVIATTGDPATPYSYADEFVEELGNATLVTVNGEGHTAVYGQSDCASKLATDYFVSGVIPDFGARCEADSAVVG